jgi:hypothetical protein
MYCAAVLAIMMMSPRSTVRTAGKSRWASHHTALSVCTCINRRTSRADVPAARDPAATAGNAGVAEAQGHGTERRAHLGAKSVNLVLSSHRCSNGPPRRPGWHDFLPDRQCSVMIASVVDADRDSGATEPAGNPSADPTPSPWH